MKCRVLGTALLLLSAAAASAQPMFDIPFDFRAGGRTLAAGTYTVSNYGTLSPLRLQSETGQRMVILPMCSIQELQAPSSGKLVFHRYGNVYFLSQLWRAGNSEGSQVPISKAEREEALAGAKTQSTEVYASVR